MKQRRRIYYLQVHRAHVLARIAETTNIVNIPCDALNHPRSLMGDFDDVEACFKTALKELRKSERMLLKPRILVHLVPKVEGGYTKVELRAFREAAESAGGFRTFMLANHDPISDAELLTVYKHLS